MLTETLEKEIVEGGDEAKKKLVKTPNTETKAATESVSGEALSFEEELESSGSLDEVAHGDIVTGTIIQISDDYIVVDVGLKGEGMIPLAEFKRLREEENLAVGKEVSVKILQTETEDGLARLSRLKAFQESRWREVQQAFTDKTIVKGVPREEVKGGFKVDLGIPQMGFLPRSQASTRKRVNPNDVIGKEMDFRIVEFDKRRKNIVLSHRSLVEEVSSEQREETLKKIAVNEIMQGVVKNITNFGVFVDLGGIDGLVTLGDITWDGYIQDASKYVTRGQKISVKVLECDLEQKPPRIRLGIKQAQGDPWEGVSGRYSIGSVVEGVVKSFTNFGAFVGLESGVDGLIHISEMSWTDHVKHPSHLLKVGDKVEAKILVIDETNKKISLGLKQLVPDPWSVAVEDYPAGKKVKGVVTGITQFGAFVKLASGIEGLIHKSDLSWDEAADDIGKVLSVNDEVEVVVLKVDTESRRISLGLKQVHPDPWTEVSQKYGRNKVVKGKVSRITNFGAFVELEEGIEGFVHISEIANEHVESVADRLTIGDEVQAKVIKLEKKGRKINLSIKAHQRDEEKRSIKMYMGDSSPATVTMGELFGEQLKKLNFDSSDEKD